MSAALRAVVFASEHPAPVAAFWATLLGRDVLDDGHGLLLPGTSTQLGLRFVTGRRPPGGANRMHLHLTSRTREHQRETVAAALGLQARHADVGQRPEDGHIVLADPAGDAFCIIEPDNDYLTGTGFLGELACEGTRGVGLFWSAALHWPLVWDQDQETAVQSPAGGTKIAWGGPPVPPVDPLEPPRFELAVEQRSFVAEVGRLVALGAVHVDGAVEGDVVMADPDGVGFRVRAS